MNMPMELAQRLKQTIDTELPRLQSIREGDAGTKPAGKWSCKEELGHLIDSASNNHLRFVRATLEPEYQGPSYDQKGSVAIHGYQDLDWSELVEFWRRYNILLVGLVARIPEQKLSTPCRVGNDQPVTLEFLIADYVSHMQHHLHHITRPAPAC
jgi:hypothetical protein